MEEVKDIIKILEGQDFSNYSREELLNSVYALRKLAIGIYRSQDELRRYISDL